jgi:DNA-binding beta-propeller fold protein YncE
LNPALHHGALGGGTTRLAIRLSAAMARTYVLKHSLGIVVASLIACLIVSADQAVAKQARWKQVDEWSLVRGAGDEGIALSRSNQVYVTRNSSHPGDPLVEDPHVLRFNRKGKLLGRFGTPGAGPGLLESPGAVAIDGAGRVYIDDGVNELELFSPFGQFITGYELTANGDALVTLDHDIDRASGDLYVAFAESGISQPDGVARFSAAGAVLAAWSGAGSGPGQFNRPAGVAYGPAGVYVVDSGNSRIQRFTAQGAFISQWGRPGSRRGQFVDPRAVAIGPQGRVFVADAGNERVQHFSRSGRRTEVVQRPKRTKAVGFLPIDLDFDSRGRMYVLNHSAGARNFVHVFERKRKRRAKR